MSWNQKTKTIIIDKNGNRQTVDSITNSSAAIDVLHNEIHKGDAYICGHLEEGVVDDGKLELMFKVPSDKEMHATFFVGHGGDAYIYIFEGPTASGGTSLVCYNKKRGSSKTSGVSVLYNPVVTASGTTIGPPEYLPGGVRQQAEGNSTSDRDEFIFDAGTTYTVRLVNKAAATKVLSVGSTYYLESV